MGVLRTTLAVTGWGSLAFAGGLLAWTRNSKIRPVAASDYIFHSTLFARYNPNRAPVTQDLCFRRVELGKVRAELLEGGEEDGKLVEAFCRGVWSGVGRF